MKRPRTATLVIAALASLALILVSGVAVWRHLGGAGGDDPAKRSAVLTPVDAAVARAAANAESCAQGLIDVTSADNARDESTLDAEISRLGECGATARTLAERGYAALDAATEPMELGDAPVVESPRRDTYLDTAGSLLSVYEMQGDDFDLIFDLLQRARANDAPIVLLHSDITSILGNGAPDIETGQKALERARDTYRAKG